MFWRKKVLKELAFCQSSIERHAHTTSTLKGYSTYHVHSFLFLQDEIVRSRYYLLWFEMTIV